MVDEILGGHIEESVFAWYLDTWRETMDARIAETTEAMRGVPGVVGLILSGSNGLGTAWPLSDIDLTPIYDESRLEVARDGVEQVRISLLDAWTGQGWRTGVDVGRLWFGVRELERAFANGDPDPGPLLRDDRWYFSIDKAYGGRVLFDHDGLGKRLTTWFTSARFSSEVVAIRLDRSAERALGCVQLATELLGDGDHAGAYGAFLKSVQWWQIELMERWGQRDNSLGRFGTRLAHEARKRERSDIPEWFDRLASLTDDEVTSRMQEAAWWVLERRDRSWAARQAVGEPVTAMENNRDVLRVCTIYELRGTPGPDFPAWLGVPDTDALWKRINVLDEFDLEWNGNNGKGQGQGQGQGQG
jgi:hypothetical protein